MKNKERRRGEGTQLDAAGEIDLQRMIFRFIWFRTRSMKHVHRKCIPSVAIRIDRWTTNHCRLRRSPFHDAHLTADIP